MTPKHQPTSAMPHQQATDSQRILVVIPTLHRGGAERVLSRLSEEWARQGHEVVVAVFDSRHVAYEVAGRIVGLDSPASNSKLMKAWRLVGRVAKIVTLIRETKPTHLIGFMEYGNFPLILAALLTGNLSRTVVSIHRNPKEFFGYQKILFPILYHLPNKIVVVSDGIKQRLQKFGVPKHKLAVIFNPPPPPQKNSLSDPHLKPVSHAKYILAVGRLHEEKGFDLLLQAYAGLPTNAPPLVILGGSSRVANQRPALIQLAKTLGISDRVIFTGEVTTPEYFYAHAECFVLSSRHEGWGLVLVEAMTYGCPVVSFDCPVGPREIITHNKNGLLVRNGDVGGLTSAIAKLLGDEKLRQRLIAGGKKRAGEFDTGTIAQSWLG